MPSPFSAAAKAALTALETGEVFLWLLTISSDQLAEPMRLVNNTESIVSRGNTFNPMPFGFTQPSSLEQETPTAKLVIPNVDKSIGLLVKQASSRLNIVAEEIVASEPDYVQQSIGNLRLINVTCTAVAVEGDLVFDEGLNEPFPSGGFTPGVFPGLF